MKKRELQRLIDELPDEVFARLEAGWPITLVLTADGERPRLRSVDPDQWWFWTPEWQAGEREVDEEIAAGKGTIYYSTEEFIAALEADLKPIE